MVQAAQKQERPPGKVYSTKVWGNLRLTKPSSQSITFKPRPRLSAPDPDYGDYRDGGGDVSRIDTFDEYKIAMGPFLALLFLSIHQTQSLGSSPLQ